MADSLNDAQRAFIIAKAHNAGRAQAMIELLGSQGLNSPAMIAAFITAATAVIQSAYAPEHRLRVLNATLAETIGEWAAEAAAAQVPVLAELDRMNGLVEELAEHVEKLPPELPPDALDRLGYGFLTVALKYLSERRGRTMGVAAAKRAADAWQVPS